MDKNYCLMLSTSLHTEVGLDVILKEDDLWEAGIETDPHITIVYSDQEPYLEKLDILESLPEILGPSEYQVLQQFLKRQELFPVLDLFMIDKFSNSERDVLILRLDPDSEMGKILEKIHTGLRKKYGIESDFLTYNPHITLAYVKSGMGDKYIGMERLHRLMKTAKVSFDDLVLSTDYDGLKADKVWNITTFHVIERHLEEERKKSGRY